VRGTDGKVHEIGTTKAVLEVISRLDNDSTAASVQKIAAQITHERLAAAEAKQQPRGRDSFGSDVQKDPLAHAYIPGKINW
jgi:hypothetical protein